MNQQGSTINSNNESDILTAVQLGWLVVESFGRLTRRRNSNKDTTTKPFLFSRNNPRSLDKLQWSMNRLRYRVNKLSKKGFIFPDLPLPFQETDFGQNSINKPKLDKEELYKELNNWSRKVWGILNVKNEYLGQAFCYGGSLANTYWYTTTLDWSKDIKDLERYRP